MHKNKILKTLSQENQEQGKKGAIKLKAATWKIQFKIPPPSSHSRPEQTLAEASSSGQMISAGFISLEASLALTGAPAAARDRTSQNGGGAPLSQPGAAIAPGPTSTLRNSTSVPPFAGLLPRS